jgi:hypothetical protein
MAASRRAGSAGSAAVAALLEVLRQRGQDPVEPGLEGEQLAPRGELAALDLAGQRDLLLGREQVVRRHVAVVALQAVGLTIVIVESSGGHGGYLLTE